LELTRSRHLTLFQSGAYYYTSALQEVTEPPLNPKEFKDFKVQSVQSLNHNTKIVRFELPRNQALNLPVASCLVTKASNEKGDVVRPYTPITNENDKGYFDLLVKKYDST
jgi:cytochrome-b5 reductase